MPGDQAAANQMRPDPSSALLEVENLSVEYGPRNRPVRVINDVSLTLRRGESLGLVGESGCGKSQTVLAILCLLPKGARISSGRVRFEGEDLLSLPARAMRRIRGPGMALVSQDALTALNPVMTVGTQMAEPLIHGGGLSKKAARDRCGELLDMVGIPGARARLASFPHELSGGMRQRVLIAMAISREPKLLIADEPTTALDVTIQSQILALIDRLRRDLGMALILISHDLGVVAGVTDRVGIMYAGGIVETASTTSAFHRPLHPYTRALIDAIPRLDSPIQENLRPIPGLPPDPARPVSGCPFHPRCAEAVSRCLDQKPSLEGRDDQEGHMVSCWVASGARAAPAAEAPGRRAGGNTVMVEPSHPPHLPDSETVVADDLQVHFPVRTGILRRTVGAVRAVDGVTFSIRAGTTLGLVGESGSGKSTTGRALLGLTPLTAGTVRCFGQTLESLRRDRGALPRLGQMVYQDPYASLNPRMTVGAALCEVLAVHRLVPAGNVSGKMRDLLHDVGLRPEIARSYPHELSGGQRQRIAIARALAIEPRLIVLDEVVSALDVSIQGQIINLLRDLQREWHLTYLFISHDLSVVRHVSRDVAVMYGGKLMEIASRDRIFNQPHHPYTHALLSAVPVPDPEVERSRAHIYVKSEPPNPADPPSGCRFQRSCPFTTDVCRHDEPPLRSVEDGHAVACHHWDRDEVRNVLAKVARGRAQA